MFAFAARYSPRSGAYAASTVWGCGFTRPTAELGTLTRMSGDPTDVSPNASDLPGGFRSVPKTGVIFVSALAREHGFAPGDPTPAFRAGLHARRRQKRIQAQDAWGGDTSPQPGC